MGFYLTFIHDDESGNFIAEDNATMSTDRISYSFKQLLDNLKLYYIKVYERYERLKGTSQPTSIQILIEDEENEITFNESLYQQLFHIYLLYGWKGLVEIENQLGGKLLKQQSYSPSAGVPAESNWSIFSATKKMLAIMIRQALINIEKRSAELIVENLNGLSIKITKEWEKYDFKVKETSTDKRGADSPGGKDLPITYEMGNKNLAIKIFNLLSDIMNNKADLDVMVDSLLKKHNQRISKQMRYTELARNYPQSDEIKEVKKGIQESEDQLIVLELIKSKAQECIDSANKILREDDPLTMLLLPMLKKKIEKTDMENLLGVVIDKLRKDVEKNAYSIDPGVSIVEKLVPFAESDVDFEKQIANFIVPDEGTETFVCETAIREIMSDSSFSPLISESTFHRLVNMGRIKKDSFEYVVCENYLEVLINKTYDKIKVQEKGEKFWKIISQIAATLSLALFLIPATAVARPVITALSTFADFAVMSNHISSVINKMAETEKTINTKLLESSDVSITLFAEIGELISIRHEYGDEISFSAWLMFISSSASSIRIIKLLVLTRGYLSDIEVLLN